MTSSAHFDDSAPLFSVITLPLLAAEVPTAQLEAVMDHAMEHLGLLRFQLFLNALEDCWPDAIKTIQVTSRPKHTFNTIRQADFSFCYANPDDDGPVANYTARSQLLKDMRRFSHDGFKPLGDLIDRVFDEGRRQVRRHELEGLLSEAMDSKTKARINSASLLEQLPQAPGAPPASKPKF